MNLPQDKAGLYLTHNVHRGVYQTAREWWEENKDHDLYSWPAGDLERALETDEVWTLQWYPDTPIGFYAIAASSLEALLAEAQRIEKEDAR